MKKVVSLLFVLVSVFVLTGCVGKSKTLTCTIDQSDQLSGMGKMDATIVSHFKGVSLESMDIKMNLEITSTLIGEDNMGTFKNIFDNVCQNGLNGISLPKCDVKQDGKKLSLDASVQKKDIKDKSGTYGTVDATKKDLESQGYTCKVTEG